MVNRYWQYEYNNLNLFNYIKYIYVWDYLYSFLKYDDDLKNFFVFGAYIYYVAILIYDSNIKSRYTMSWKLKFFESSQNPHKTKKWWRSEICFPNKTCYKFIFSNYLFIFISLIINCLPSEKCAHHQAWQIHLPSLKYNNSILLFSLIFFLLYNSYINILIVDKWININRFLFLLVLIIRAPIYMD